MGHSEAPQGTIQPQTINIFDEYVLVQSTYANLFVQLTLTTNQISILYTAWFCLFIKTATPIVYELHYRYSKYYIQGTNNSSNKREIRYKTSNINT